MSTTTPFTSLILCFSIFSHALSGLSRELVLTHVPTEMCLGRKSTSKNQSRRSRDSKTSTCHESLSLVVQSNGSSLHPPDGQRENDANWQMDGGRCCKSVAPISSERQGVEGKMGKEERLGTPQTVTREIIFRFACRLIQM